MKSSSLKSVLFAALALVSLSCFIYVNTTSLDRTLQVESANPSTVDVVEEVEHKAKMPDLTLMKNVWVLVQTFFPAK
jgi:hypothetical protein